MRKIFYFIVFLTLCQISFGDILKKNKNKNDLGKAKISVKKKRIKFTQDTPFDEKSRLKFIKGLSKNEHKIIIMIKSRAFLCRKYKKLKLKDDYNFLYIQFDNKMQKLNKDQLNKINVKFIKNGITLILYLCYNSFIAIVTKKGFEWMKKFKYYNGIAFPKWYDKMKKNLYLMASIIKKDKVKINIAFLHFVKLKNIEAKIKSIKGARIIKIQKTSLIMALVILPRVKIKDLAKIKNSFYLWK